MTTTSFSLLFLFLSPHQLVTSTAFSHPSWDVFGGTTNLLFHSHVRHRNNVNGSFRTFAKPPHLLNDFHRFIHPRKTASGKYSDSFLTLSSTNQENETTTSQPTSETINPHPKPITGVTLKMAFDSSDSWGVADLSETKSERFTSPASLDMVHRLRRESCAVLVGRGTVERDDCSLTVRRVELREGEEQPVRVVLDPCLRLVGGDFTLLKDGLRTIIYYAKSGGDGRENCHLPDLSSLKFNDFVTLVGLEGSVQNDNGIEQFILSPEHVINDLEQRGLHHVMVEGGPATARAFIEAGVVDRAILVRAPIEFEIPVAAGMDETTLNDAGLTLIGTSEMGGDCVEYWTKNGMDWPSDVLSDWP